MNKLIVACMRNPLVVCLLVGALVWFGQAVSPFATGDGTLDPVAVDAIPDIGENQQIVFTDWPGRSPQDVEDQVTYPLTSALLGIAGVKTIRSNSMFGFSTIYVIFDESVDFYFSRTRILEKLNSLPPGTLPTGVTPTLGPDATALGQIFWYTLEGRDPDGNPTGGWDLAQLRTIQDWTVRYALQSVKGVAEVSSIGGFVREYQVDVNPDAMKSLGVTLRDVLRAVQRSNLDVGAKTVEINGPEYVIRGLGFVRDIDDLASAVVKVEGDTPVYVREVAEIAMGPALRRGLLDKSGAEAVGGVVVSRFGANPLETLRGVHDKIDEIAGGLPSKVLDDGTVSQVTIVPFYDRGHLIRETLHTLEEALTLEIIITVIVVLMMVLHLRSALLISSLLPLTVLGTFIAMKMFGVDANVVALSGIVIAIGTIVDMGIVLSENILRTRQDNPEQTLFKSVADASTEVGSAVLTAVATTVVSFLPVFLLEGSEGKLFKPLAYTKTFALVAAIMISLLLIPTFAYLLERASQWRGRGWPAYIITSLIVVGGAVVDLRLGLFIAAVLVIHQLIVPKIAKRWRDRIGFWGNVLLAAFGAGWLAVLWQPLGIAAGPFANVAFTLVLIVALLGSFRLFIAVYPRLLAWCLEHKAITLLAPGSLLVFGLVIWLGFAAVFRFVPASLDAVGFNGDALRKSNAWVAADHAFPAMGKEFMPYLDEGSFLYMPTTMPHASLGAAQDILAKMDMAITAIPEVDVVVGKIGRVDSALDPAPISMVETVIHYVPEFKSDADGRRLRFRYDHANETFARDGAGQLIQDAKGRPYRQWRDHIQTPDDIWEEIVRVAKVPGATDAPKLQPISTRIVMLQSGMRAPMGIKIKGPDLATIEAVGLRLEQYLQEVPAVRASAVFAERIVGKPYLEFHIDRDAIARYGLNIQDVTDVIEMAIGGKTVSYTVEGRERYPIRIRYPRELRNDLDSLQNILIPVRGDLHIPLVELAELRYKRGPQSIKSEDASLVSYVLFDKNDSVSEVEAKDAAEAYLNQKKASGEWVVPAGVTYDFAGTFENQIRSEQRLAFILPVALGIIFMIIYFQFRGVLTSLVVVAAIPVAMSGGFLMLWLYSQDWFLNMTLLGIDFREVFQIQSYNLSVAVWVGFLALFGIATDDAVIMATYIQQNLTSAKPGDVAGLRQAVVEAGARRIRPCLMTSATTILALLPVLTSQGRGSDIMIPMAIPSFGGMIVVLVTVFVVPTLYAAKEEAALKVAEAS